MRYDIQLDRAFSACMSGDFSKGEEIVNDIINNYGWIERGIHLLLCIYSCTSQREKAISLLQRLEQESVWLNPVELENDIDLDTLRDIDEFKKLQKFSWDRYSYASENAQRKIYVMGENNDAVAPIYFFHGRGTMAAEFSEDFQEIFEGRQVYYVQSEQVYSAGRYCWDNEERAILHIEDVLVQSNKLQKLVSGVSQGARILVNAFAQGKIKDDMLLFIPAVSKESVSMVRNANIKYEGTITIILGGRDTCFSASMKLIEILKGKGYNTRFHTINGMGHYILPQEIKNKLIFEGLKYNS